MRARVCVCVCDRSVAVNLWFSINREMLEDLGDEEKEYIGGSVNSVGSVGSGGFGVDGDGADEDGGTANGGGGSDSGGSIHDNSKPNSDSSNNNHHHISLPLSSPALFSHFAAPPYDLPSR